MKKLSLALMIISLQACGITNNTTTETPQASIISQQASFSEEDKLNYTKEMCNFISGDSKINTEYIVDNLEIDDSDIQTGLGAMDLQRYFSSNACYISVGGYLYRFQLNEQGQIESYIKYNVEA